jgi:tetratricopeptide (TPR) repeat protein/transcriptional regulator with XRE-family HTH domain
VPQGYGELVRGYRVAAGLTQEELAALAGLDVRTIRDIERGRTARPHRSSADLLARALNRDDLAWKSARARLPGLAGRGTASPGTPESAGHADGTQPPQAIPQQAIPQQAIPRQLPGAVRYFTGRAGELAVLTGLLDQAGQERPGTVVISAIGGTAGVGKTALAVQWAHQAEVRFPDGQLYADLRGYGPDRPMPAADVLSGFLRALGVAGGDIPPDADERAARYRSLVAGRRMLVLLDNARSAEQIRPLLPGTSSCVTVVTSRDALAGLVARDGAARVDLGLLPLADATGLLRVLIGARASADPAATRMLADRCGRLPLALRVAAERAAARPADPLASLVAELAGQRDRLDVLDAGGDPATAVRTVFSWSCRHLDPAAARMFRLAGLHPGADLDAYAAAALTASPAVAPAAQLLERLARAHLIHPAGPGRYGMHDLLRSYAAELAAAAGEDDCQAALTRLFDHYLHTAALAMDTLYPAGRHLRPAVPASSAAVPPVTDPATARSWLDDHRAVLVAVTEHAADGWPGHATRLSATLAQHLHTTGCYAEAISMHTGARRAARRLGDRSAEAGTLIRLGGVDLRQGRYPQAARHFRQALALYRVAEDRAGEARALENLGLIEAKRGRYPQATRHQQQALDLFRAIGDQTGEADTLGYLGEVDLRQGRYPQASTHFREALALFREVGDPADEAYALGNLGEIDLHQGRYPQATRHFREALAVFREAGDRVNEAYALGNLGEVDLHQGRYPQATRHFREALAVFTATGERVNVAYALAGLGEVELRQGRYPQAAGHFRQALDLLRQAGDRADEARALNGLGEALLGDGQTGPARTEHATALALARRTGDKGQQARACYGLGHACLTAGEPGEARRHWQHALTLYTQLGDPESDHVRASMRSLGRPPVIPHETGDVAISMTQP